MITNMNARQEFELVYKTNYKSVLNYVKYKVNNSVIAEEITSEAFIKAFRFYDTFNNKSSIKSWLLTIAITTISDHFRVDKSDRYTNVGTFVDSETGKETFQFVSEETSDGKFERKELKHLINNAFIQLKPKYREIAELYFINQMKYQEIAEICNVPIGTVKGMVNRSREMLQAKLVHIKSEYV